MCHLSRSITNISDKDRPTVVQVGLKRDGVIYMKFSPFGTWDRVKWGYHRVCTVYIRVIYGDIKRDLWPSILCNLLTVMAMFPVQDNNELTSIGKVAENVYRETPIWTPIHNIWPFVRIFSRFLSWHFKRISFFNSKRRNPTIEVGI